MSVFSVVAYVFIACILIIIVKEHRPEIALIMSIGASIFLILAIISKMSGVLGDLKALINGLGINREYLIVLVKALGICYIITFASDTCTDFGFKALASKIELFGKVLLAVLSLPLIIDLINMITKLLN